jgi:hypothetical protein
MLQPQVTVGRIINGTVAVSHKRLFDFDFFIFLIISSKYCSCCKAANYKKIQGLVSPT